MRACVQRVTSASVTVEGQVIGEIGRGLLVLLGVATEDTQADSRELAEKIVNLRIFEDGEGKMNRSLRETGGSILIVSQFTLLGDCRKGRRPSFIAAAPPEQGARLYESFISEVAARHVTLATGRFRANMQVALVNDGPVTLLLDTKG